MNLGKLLAAGKSVINERRDTLYRVNKRVYLPKFATVKDSFPFPVGTPLAKVATETTVAPMGKAVSPVLAKTQKLPAMPAAPSAAGSWACRLNPILLWRHSPPPAQRPLSPMQAELSLDAVKVVHNDLSDADVEVVPIKSRPAGGSAGAAAGPAAGEDAWSRFGAKWFGIKTA